MRSVVLVMPATPGRCARLTVVPRLRIDLLESIRRKHPTGLHAAKPPLPLAKPAAQPMRAIKTVIMAVTLEC